MRAEHISCQLLLNLVDKEFARRAQPEDCGQWLYVQMETGSEWCPLGVRLGSGTLKHLYQ